uniref:Uncharacterized protein n=1 Tax=Arundo donax TaxID=35708 RepID=A0A0A9H9W6_ARUDO
MDDLKIIGNSGKYCFANPVSVNLNKFLKYFCLY